MAVIDPQAAIDAAQPFCCVPQGDLWYGVLGALIAVGNGDPMPDAQELMDDIACLKCAVQPGDLPLLIIGAVSSITGGGGATQVYEGRDPAPPDNVNLAAVSFPTGGGTLTQWSVDLQAWV